MGVVFGKKVQLVKEVVHLLLHQLDLVFPAVAEALGQLFQGDVDFDVQKQQRKEADDQQHPGNQDHQEEIPLQGPVLRGVPEEDAGHGVGGEPGSGGGCTPPCR